MPPWRLMRERIAIRLTSTLMTPSERHDVRAVSHSGLTGQDVPSTFNSSAYLQERHGVPPELLPNIAAVEALAAKAVE
jgi:hypothetical protein